MENKHCSRCNGSFECKAGDILNCQCSGIVFSDAQKEVIARDFSDCLCRKCLLELEEGVVSLPAISATGTPALSKGEGAVS